MNLCLYQLSKTTSLQIREIRVPRLPAAGQRRMGGARSAPLDRSPKVGLHASCYLLEKYWLVSGYFPHLINV